jgi:predicted deacetylase
MTRRTDAVQQSKTDMFVRDKTALLSLHDVSPAFEDDVVKSCDRLSDLGLGSFTLLVTPFYGMKMSNSLEKNEIFSKYLQSLGLELSLHGYSHLSKSGTGDEFSRIALDRAVARLRSGFSAIEKTLGHKPIGFVPPLWQAPLKMVDAAREVGFSYCVIGNKLYSFADSRAFTTGRCLISEGSTNTSFVDSVVELELGGAVQVGVHPMDYRANKVFELLEDMRDRLDYHFIGYFDYLRSVP